ncbi:MAG TPA: hypothetical protein VMA37_08830 [Acetobacteraceae bacterium]|nr:hypothetical protein [Acetobacteraceae bacterium]
MSESAGDWIADIWEACRALTPVAAHERLAELTGQHRDAPTVWGAIAAFAPVMVDGGYFQLHPRPKSAARDRWYWILAVRRYPEIEVLGTRERTLEAATIWAGEAICDLFACDRALEKIVGRLTGQETAIGYPADGRLTAEPVRVHETPLAWLRAGPRGVLLAGTPSENAQWLLTCETGIAASSIRHAESLRTLMARPVPPMPRLLVAA